MAEQDHRADAHDDSTAAEAQERHAQALVGRMTPIDPGAGAGGTIVTEAAEVRAQDRERAGPEGGAPSADPAASPVASSAVAASSPRSGRDRRVKTRRGRGKEQRVDYLIACFVDAPAARETLGTLQRAGFVPEDLLALNGSSAYEETRRLEAASPLRRLVFGQAGAEEGDAATGGAAHLDALKRGHSIVFVYTPDEETDAKAYRVVAATQAYRISRRGATQGRTSADMAPR